MKRCIIITAWAPDGIRSVVDICEEDFIVCADGGYTFACNENIQPHVLVGDFDSLADVPDQLPERCRVIRANREKNETDTLLSLQCGMEAGCDSFVVVGGIGGRLDHTFANLQLLNYAANRNISMWLMDKNNRVTLTLPGILRIPRAEGYYLSVLAFNAQCKGVTLGNVKYPLSDALLTDEFPLGISNEIQGSEARIELREGRLLVFLCRDCEK
jgi:thiamine pyrophosphokinase